MRKFTLTSVLILFCILQSASASLLQITATSGDFTGTSGTVISGPLEIVFQIDSSVFDGSDVDNSNAGINLISSDIPLDSEFVYTIMNSPTDVFFTVGGISNGAIGISSGTDDFLLQILNPLSTPAYSVFSFTQSTSAEFFLNSLSAGDDFSGFSLTVSQVPLPATVVPIASGLLSLIFFIRRKITNC